MVTQTSFPVQWMSCTGCDNNNQMALTSLKAVHSADADHRVKSVRVDYHPAVASTGDIHRVIEDLGYRMVDV